MLESSGERLDLERVEPGRAADVNDAQLATLDEPLNRARVNAQELSGFSGREQGRCRRGLGDHVRLGVTFCGSARCKLGCRTFARVAIQNRRPVVEAELVDGALVM